MEYIFEFLIDGIIPESISILFINLLDLINIFRRLDAKLVGTLPVPGLDLGYNHIATYENIWDPLCKSRLLRDIFCHGIFHCNNWFSYLEILQWSTGCLPILPFNKQFPPFHFPTHVFIAVLAGNVHIIAANGMAIFLMVNDFLQWMIFVSIVI